MSEPLCAVFEVVIAENPPKRLDKAIARDVPEEAALSRSRLAKSDRRGRGDTHCGWAGEVMDRPARQGGRRRRAGHFRAGGRGKPYRPRGYPAGDRVTRMTT